MLCKHFFKTPQKGGLRVLFATILANIYLFSGIKFISIKDDNKYAYIYIISVIVIFIVFYILFKII